MWVRLSNSSHCVELSKRWTTPHLIVQTPRSWWNMGAEYLSCSVVSSPSNPPPTQLFKLRRWTSTLRSCPAGFAGCLTCHTVWDRGEEGAHNGQLLGTTWADPPPSSLSGWLCPSAADSTFSWSSPAALCGEIFQPWCLFKKKKRCENLQSHSALIWDPKWAALGARPHFRLFTVSSSIAFLCPLELQWPDLEVPGAVHCWICLLHVCTFHFSYLQKWSWVVKHKNWSQSDFRFLWKPLFF